MSSVEGILIPKLGFHIYFFFFFFLPEELLAEKVKGTRALTPTNMKAKGHDSLKNRCLVNEKSFILPYSALLK